MAQNKRSWLDGPQIPSEYDDGTQDLSAYPGQSMGLPEDGVGSLASVRRRIGGVLIDWVLCYAIVAGITSLSIPITYDTILDFSSQVATNTYFLWIILGIVSVWIFARTPGQAVLGMGVARVDEPGAKVGIWRPVVRTLLTAFVLPAAIVDTEGRGMHDRATGTTVIRG